MSAAAWYSDAHWYFGQGGEVYFAPCIATKLLSVSIATPRVQLSTNNHNKSIHCSVVIGHL